MHSILTFNDSTLLQQDINSIMLWCSRSKLNINADKCAVLHFSLSVADSPTYTYKVNNHVLQFLDHYRDLGILVSTSLNWTLHYNHICSKAYQSLQLIRRIIPLNSSTSLKKLLYLSLVRSHLIYCSQLWRPHYIKDICRLEKIQRRATKFILNDYTSDYKSRLITLELLPLMYYYELQDILFFIKCIIDPPDNFNILNYVHFSTRTHPDTQNRILTNFARTTTTRFYYFNRIAKLWNSLPYIDITLPMGSIKDFLLNHFRNHFEQNFIPENYCTYHYKCPCYKCY